MDPKEMREQTIKDAKCGIILDAARKVFSEKGYLNARLEDIAAQAGFSKPTLYSYFQDKESIFLSLAIREMQDMTQKIDIVVLSEGSFVETLESILRIFFANFTQIFSYFNTASNFRAMGGMEIDASKRKELMERFHEIMGKCLQSIEVLIQRSRKTGEVSSNLDPAELSWFIISLIQGVHMRSWMTRKACDVDASVKQMVDFIIHGISPKKPQTGRVVV
jgi:Transcriptional regulator